jgi:hypothetical protein
MSSLCLASLVSLPVWVIFQCYIIMELCLFGEYSVIRACNSTARINASVDSKCCWRYSFPCLTTPLTVNVRHIDCVWSNAQTHIQVTESLHLSHLSFHIEFFVDKIVLCSQQLFTASPPPPAQCWHHYWDMSFSNERLQKRGFVVSPEQREKADTSLTPPSCELSHTTVYRLTAVTRQKANTAETPGPPWNKKNISQIFC